MNEPAGTICPSNLAKRLRAMPRSWEFFRALEASERDGRCSRAELEAVVFQLLGDPKIRPWCIQRLIYWGNADILSWIERNRRELEGPDWKGIAEVLSGHPERAPPRLRAFIHEVAVSESNSDIRAEAIWATAYLGATREEALSLTKWLEVEESPFVRSCIFSAVGAFDDPATNRLLRKLLVEGTERKTIELLIEGDLVRYARYDFLPELKELRRRTLKPRRGIQEKYEAEEHRERLDRAIAQLEELKRKNAPRGRFDRR